MRSQLEPCAKLPDGLWGFAVLPGGIFAARNAEWIHTGCGGWHKIWLWYGSYCEDLRVERRKLLEWSLLPHGLECVRCPSWAVIPLERWRGLKPPFRRVRLIHASWTFWMKEEGMDERINGWMDGWMDGWMNEWMNEWNEWMNEWMNERVIDWESERVKEWMRKSVNEWMNQWKSERVSEWVSAWVNWVRE